MNHLFMLTLSVFLILFLNACGGGSSSGSSSSSNTEESSNIQQLTTVENKDAISPPALPSVAENPTVSLN